jgi:hypothetical protein
MRLASGEVRDHIVSHKNDHGPSYRRYGALLRQRRQKSTFAEFLVPFDFSTLPINGHRQIGPARQVRLVPDSDGGAVLCAEPCLTHLKGDDRSSRRPTCRYRAAKLIRETANNELSTKS